MKQREKIFVIGGGVLLLLVVAWKLTRPGAAAAVSTSSIPGAIQRINEGERVRKSVEGLVRELAIEVPQAPTAEQESQIRTDLARKAKECKLVVISQVGIKSTSRAARSVQMVQYRLDLYGLYDDFMRFLSALEQAPIPYLVREVQFDSSPKAPTAEGQQGEGGEGQQGQEAPPPDDGPRGRSGRGRRGGGPEGSGGPNDKANQPNGRVHVTMRVQSYLFPVEVAVKPTAAEAAPTTGTTPQSGGPNHDRPASTPAPESRR